GGTLGIRHIRGGARQGTAKAEAADTGSEPGEVNMSGKLGRLVAGCVVLMLSATHAEALGDVLQLLEAVKRGDRAAVQKLLKDGSDVSARWGDGTTALHWAVHLGDAATADLLIQAGADVNAANDHGVTPLALACTNG